MLQPVLSPTAQKFILHWGEMGARWGINRTVAQVHALLYLAERPLNAEEIAAALSIARSNVSTSVRELQGWGIVKVVHLLGDRRDHFESMTDVWQMFQVVLDERKKREIDPTMALLEQCLAEAHRDRATGEHVRKRLAAMLEFFQSMTTWYAAIRRMPQGAVLKLAKVGQQAGRMLGAKP